jgi:hypothetical protein
MREATTGLGLAEKLAVSPTDKMQRICAMGVLRDERAAPMDTELLGFEIPGVVARWRQEAITARAVRTSQGSAGVIKSLAAVRRRYDELMTRAAAAPEATLGQRLYTARRRANLTAAEAAARRHPVAHRGIDRRAGRGMTLWSCNRLCVARAKPVTSATNCRHVFAATMRLPGKKAAQVP